jgi:hypothetical protein
MHSFILLKIFPYQGSAKRKSEQIQNTAKNYRFKYLTDFKFIETYAVLLNQQQRYLMS